MTKTLRAINIFFVLLITFFTLTACMPMYSSEYSFQNPKSSKGKQCVSSCIESRSHCTMKCAKHKQQCMDNARLAALPTYIEYMKNADEQSKNPGRTVDSFADYGNCDSSCGCDESYNQCFGSCGGVITEHKQCVAFCDKVPPGQLSQTRKVYQ